MTQLGAESTAEEVAKVFKDEIRGKTVLITGVTQGGLGAEVALAISRSLPKLLILAGRDLAKAQATETAIKSVTPGASIRLLKLDLSSQKQIRQAADEVNGYQESIDRLINNAAIMATSHATTEDGIESQFGTNHIGHFLFTNLIMPKIFAAGQGARIVNVSSAGHRRSPVRFDDYNFGNGTTYDKWKAYGQAKTANILFTVALVEKVGHKGVLSYSLYPGRVPTNIAQNISRDEMRAAGWMDENGNLIQNKALNWRTMATGSATHVMAAFDPSIVDQNGSYLVDCHIDMNAVEPYAKDKVDAMKLWALSEMLVGQKFDFSQSHSNRQYVQQFQA